MPAVTTDAYGHESGSSVGTLGTALAAGAVSTTAIGTIVPLVAAGATPTVTAVTANDRCGTFVLNPVTGGGAQAAGAVAQVFFAQPYAAVPKAVSVNLCDNAAGAGAVAVAVAPQSITATGFTVNVSAALTTAHNYTVTYQVAA
ncbi:MAG: H-type lectin domain-containing protein [Catenulispora sp.]|jgi:hypothetical protein